MAGKATSKPSKAPKPKPAKRSKSPAKPKARAAAAKKAAKIRKAAAPKPSAPARSVGSPKVRSGDADLSVAGQIYQRGKLAPGILHIDTASGRIVRVSKSTALDEHLDFGKKVLLPGALDLHVHFREPGHTHKEDFLSGSTSAAFGGVTGFVDMPNTLPATTTLRAAKDKLALAASKSVVDYAVWAGGTWYTQELPDMLKVCAGVKTYLGASTGDLLLEDIGRLQAILSAAATAGKPVVLHAEAQRVLQQLRRSEAGVADHDQLRPPLAEVEAIYDAMKAVAAIKKAPVVHIAHAASTDAIQAATAAKFSTGVCPHHLLLDTDAPLRHAYGKMNPPLRSPAAREALWKVFAAGKIPILESDHAPHTSVEKEDNFHAAPSGVPGVETMMPLLLAQAKAGHVDLRTVVDAATVNPAALIGASDRGALEPGLRADFAVYEWKPTKVDEDNLHSKCGWSPFDGHNAIFPSHTFLAGRAVMEEHELVAAAGSGRSILPLKL